MSLRLEKADAFLEDFTLQAVWYVRKAGGLCVKLPLLAPLPPVKNFPNVSKNLHFALCILH